MKKCNAPNPLGLAGDPIFCAMFIAEKRASASKFLWLLKEVGSQVTFATALAMWRILQMCTNC